MPTKASCHGANVDAIHTSLNVSPSAKKSVLRSFKATLFQLSILCLRQRSSTICLSNDHIVPMICIQMLADGRIFVLIVKVHRCAPPTLKLCLLPQSFDFFVAFVPPVHTTLKYRRRSLIRHQVTLVPCRGPSILHAIRSILCHGSLWADRAPRPLHHGLKSQRSPGANV